MKSIRRFAAAVLALLLLLTGNAASAAEKEAGNITARFTVAVSENKNRVKNMTNGNYTNFWEGKPGSVITFNAKGNEKAQGVCLSFHGVPVALTATAPDGTVIGRGGGLFENDYIAFDRDVQAFTLTVPAESAVEISNLQVVQAGELPSWVQRWEILEESADMMLISTHPDDELLWFGGMLPTYSGALGKKVMVVYMVGGNNPKRKNELLDGLWTCGVRYYPEIGSFPDMGAYSYNSVIANWGAGEAEKRIVEMLRKYRPEVVVTQDIQGEYGHFHHIVTVEAAIKAVTALSADGTYAPESAELYGVWGPKKLYLHLYKENQIIFDWRQPLDCFGGKTSLEVAKEAFKKHVSQQNGRYTVSDAGKLNCSVFGLYYSTVGEDLLHQDIFENIE